MTTSWIGVKPYEFAALLNVDIPGRNDSVHVYPTASPFDVPLGYMAKYWKEKSLFEINFKYLENFDAYEKLYDKSFVIVHDGKTRRISSIQFEDPNISVNAFKSIKLILESLLDVLSSDKDMSNIKRENCHVLHKFISNHMEELVNLLLKSKKNV